MGLISFILDLYENIRKTTGTEAETETLKGRKRYNYCTEFTGNRKKDLRRAMEPNENSVNKEIKGDNVR